MQKKKSLKNQRLLFVSRVELEGIEPSSAQGNHMLSTCLFQTSIFEVWQDLDHQPYPYPLKFHPGNEGTRTISDLPAPLDQQDSELHLLSDVPFQHLVPELS